MPSSSFNRRDYLKWIAGGLAAVSGPIAALKLAYDKQETNNSLESQPNNNLQDYEKTVESTQYNLDNLDRDHFDLSDSNPEQLLEE